jgi:YfiH family protein
MPQQILTVTQQHGDRIIDRIGAGPASTSVLGAADGIVSNQPGEVLLVLGADCPGVILIDPRRRCAGSVHSGWRGTAAGIGAQLVAALVAKGSVASDLVAFIGPGIRRCCYEVGEEVFVAMAAAHPDAARWRVARRGPRDHLDLIMANHDLLVAAGVAPQAIHDSGLCTACDERLFSYRREGPGCGHQAALVMIGTARAACGERS